MFSTLKHLRNLGAQQQVLLVLQNFIQDIIEKSGFRDAEQIIVFLIESGYELLPFPIRAIVKKETFVKVINENRVKVLEIIAKNLKS